MPLIRHHPAAPLDRHIECLWWSQRDTALSYHEHILPSGGAQLVFALHESPLQCSAGPDPADWIRWSHAMVHGPQRYYYIAGPKPRGAGAGVSFRPGAVAALLGVPMSQLTDRHVPLEALWGSRAGVLHERLMTCTTPASVFSLLQTELLARLAPALLMHRVVAEALMPTTGIVHSRIGDVQHRSGFSARHFNALFRHAVGLTPKHYQRVQRFRTALPVIASADAADLAGVAVAAGYADQAHFTREFREFAGVTPTSYRPRDAGSVLHHRVV